MLARTEQAGGPGAQGDDRADRDAATEPLGQRDDVRDDAVPGVREPGAGAPDAALHLVQDEQRAMLRSDLARRGEVALG